MSWTSLSDVVRDDFSSSTTTLTLGGGSMSKAAR